MSHRKPLLRLVPPSEPPQPNPLHVVDAERLPTGWTRVEVWRRGDLIARGEGRSDEVPLDFLRGLAAFWLGDRDAVTVRNAAEQTGT